MKIPLLSTIAALQNGKKIEFPCIPVGLTVVQRWHRANEDTPI